MDEYKMIRFELYPENEKRLIEAIQHIQKEYDFQISPNRLINMLISSIDSFEFQSEVIVTLKQQPAQSASQQVTKPPPLKIRRNSTWMSRL
jgi:hypothetical protein